MKKALFIFTGLIALSGCKTTIFLNNSPADAHSVGQSVHIKLIASENTIFRINKINSENYALIPDRFHDSNPLIEINDSIIFGMKDIEELRKTCKKIIENYDINVEKDTQVIEYHLTLNRTRFEGVNSAQLSGNTVNTSTQVSEIQPVIFRLQFVHSSESTLSSGKKIEYMFGGWVEEISIDDLKALLGDLQK